MKAMNPFLDRRRLLAGLAVLTLTAVLSGCTGKRDGTALPAISNSPVASSTTSSGAPTNIFGSLKACEVLNRALEGQAFPPGALNTIGGDNGCNSEKSQFGSVSVDLQPALGIADLNADKSKQHDGKVNGRPAIEIRDAIGSGGDCDIAIEVTKTSRAMVGVSLSDGNTDEACTFVESVANKVEPQLPKGN